MHAVHSSLGLIMLMSTAPTVTVAQSGVVTGRALELERRGRYEEAADAYRALLSGAQANDVALLGLERVLTRLGKLELVISVVDSLLASAPANRLLHEIELRAWASLNQPDSVAAAGERWVEMSPGSVEPYRHWAIATSRTGQTDRAIDILLTGRQQLGGTSLAPELGRMYGSARRWIDAALEWSNAVRINEQYLAAGAAGLGTTLGVARSLPDSPSGLPATAETGRNASMRRSVISTPLLGSGARWRSRRPSNAIW